MELDEFLRVLASFEKEGLEYVLVGAAALNLHGIVRATEDVDIFVRPDAENIARLRRALQAIYDDPHIEEITAEDLLGEYPVVRYGPPTGTLYLDILTRLGEFTRYEELESQEVKIGGVTIRVATPSTLYRLKKQTVRPIDRMDAEALRERFDLEDSPED